MRCLVLVGLVACGDNGGAGPPDAATGCAAAQPLMVQGRPALAIHGEQLTLTMLSHDATGAVCTTTTASGDAPVSIDAPPGGMVTMVIESDFTNPEAFTWTGVQPGDHLVFPTQLFRDQDSASVPVEMTIPAFGADYAVIYACDDGIVAISASPPPGLFDDTVVCSTAAAKIATTVVATLPSGHTSYAIGDIVPIGTGTTTIALSAPSTVAVPVTLHGGLAGDGAFVSAGWRPAPVYGNYNFIVDDSFDATGSVTGSLDVPTVGPLVVSFAVTSQMFSRGIVNRTYATVPTSIDVASTELLPVITPTFDMSGPSPSVTWGTTAIDADVAFINVGNWVLAADANMRNVTFPSVPNDIFKPDTSGNGLLIVDALEATAYDDVRQDPAATLLSGQENRSSRSGASFVFHDP